MASDLAVDLGTSTTRIVSKGGGIVAAAPTAVAVHRGANGTQFVAIGERAKQMQGRTASDTTVIRPLQQGVISDFVATEHLLQELLRAPALRGLRRPRLLVCVPAETTEVQRRAVQESARAAGGRDIRLVPTPTAAALGAGLPIEEPVGSMVIDIGGGRTEVAILSLSGVVVKRSIPVAGDVMNEAIVTWIRRTHGVVIGDATAELIKHGVGAADEPETFRQMRVRGRDLHSASARELDLTSSDIVQALQDPLDQIREVIVDALRACPPEISADLIDRGVILCGGSAALPELDAVLREATTLPVLTPMKPDECVARGLEALLDKSALFERLCF